MRRLQPLKLVSFSLPNLARRRLGVVSSKSIVDLYAAQQNDYFVDMKSFLQEGEKALQHAEEIVKSESGKHSVDISSVELHAPITNPEKIVCVGLNYFDHAKECNMPVPSEPVLFSKYPSTIVGPRDNVIKPKVTNVLDYEVELVIVVGKTGKDITKEKAMEHVAGYMVANDISARDWQLHKPAGQWMAGKTFDTFAPLGPCIQTIRHPIQEGEFDPHNASIRCILNGKVVQDSNTSDMIFKTPELISYISQIMTLKPGDLIFTGTPYGVGFSRTPQILLNPGDVLETEISGLGVDGYGYMKNVIVE